MITLSQARKSPNQYLKEKILIIKNILENVSEMIIIYMIIF